jgi:hypothetical protein
MQKQISFCPLLPPPPYSRPPLSPPPLVALDSHPRLIGALVYIFTRNMNITLFILSVYLVRCEPVVIIVRHISNIVVRQNSIK